MLVLWSSLAEASSPSGPPAPALVASEAPPSATKRGPANNGKPHPVEARLLARDATLRPGTDAVLGVHLTQDAGWHTYWKAPGDVGQPTEIAWALPAGFTAEPHAFPLPERFEQSGQVSYGYDGAVLLASVIHVPKDAQPGPIRVSATVSWLVCSTSCIPGEAVLERTLEVAAAEPAPGPNAASFDHYAARHPTALGAVSAFTVTGLAGVSAIQPEGKFRAAFLVTPAAGVTLKAADARVDGVVGAWPTFVPVSHGYDWGVAATTVKALPDGRLALLVDGETYAPDPLPSAAEHLGGLLQLEVSRAGGPPETVRTEVDLAIPWAAKGAAVTPSADPVFGITVAAATPPPEPPAAEPAARPLPDLPPPSGNAPSTSLAFNLLLAFVGGLILNVMPCVLPVLTLKVYGLVEEAEMTAAKRRTSGLAYTAGVIASFWAMAAAILVVRGVFGIEPDWGFQFQYPPYVAALATVVFGFGLSLLGVFELPVLGGEVAGDAASREGPAGIFFSGAFATLLATPCSAPFLGGAVAYAFSAPTATLFLIFTVIGLGLAAPFLGVALAPSLARFLPAPGPWMDTFKQLLGFTLLATAVWLVDVLFAQIGLDRGVSFLGFLVAVGASCWIFGKWGGVAESRANQLRAAVVALVVMGGSGAWLLDLDFAEAAECGPATPLTDLDFGEGVPWQPFSEPAVASLEGKVVFIDFTAEWCLTCKVNERTILESETVRRAMAAGGVVPLKADWTRRDEVITEWLRRNGRAAVPMYLVLPKDRTKAPILLPEVITTGMVTAALADAGA